MVKKLKHNKLKNTGLIFEILSRCVMNEVLNVTTEQKAFKIIKRHFSPDSELLKELQLYQGLSLVTEHDPDQLIEISLQTRKKLNEQNLSNEKFKLIRSIKLNYDLNKFFETRVTNYKLSASIFKLFENQSYISPSDYLTAKKTITESIKGSNPEIDLKTESFWRTQDPDIRNLGFKFLINEFNDRYKGLTSKQKALLSKYINEDASSYEFKSYVVNECTYINKRLNQLKGSVEDEITKIKLTETINLVDSIISSKQIKDDHLSAMLKYYELIEELEK